MKINRGGNKEMERKGRGGEGSGKGEKGGRERDRLGR